jgi:O-antigen/teichoic acid export membrane protein
MNPLKKLAGQTAIYGVSSIIGRVLNFLLTPLYTRVFERASYGVVTELYAYVAFLIVFLTYGMETAFFRFGSKAESEKEQKQVFSTAFLAVASTTLLFLAFVLLNLDSVAGSLGYDETPEYIVFFAIIVSLDVLSTIPLARLRLREKAIPFASINLASIFANIGLNLFFLIWCPLALEDPANFSHSFVESFYVPEFGIGYIFLSNLISSAIKFLLLIPWLGEAKSGFNTPIFKKLISYSLPLLLLGLAGIVNETFDRAYFTRLSGLPELEAKRQLGVYGASYKVAMLLSIGIQAYRFAAEPFVFSLKSGAEGKKTQADIMKYYVIFASLICLVILCFLDVAMLLIGEDYREGKGVVPILLLAYLFFGALFNLSFWYKLNDRTIYGALIAIIGAIVTIGMNIILVPKIGYYGSAYATLGAYTIMLVVSYFLGKKHYAIPYNILELASFAGLAGLLYGAHTLLALEGSLKYLSGSIAVIMYIGFIISKEKWILQRFKS